MTPGPPNWLTERAYVEAASPPSRLTVHFADAAPAVFERAAAKGNQEEP